MNVTSKEELDLIYKSIYDIMAADKTGSDTAFETWFSDLSLISVTEDKIVFGSPNELKRKVLASRYYEFIVKCVNKALGFTPEVEIICSIMQNVDEINGFKTDKAEEVEPERKSFSDETAVGLCAEYTLDNFVVGSSNQLAYACSQKVASDPSGPHGYNPLFIYGPSGLGKTHLMYAIANEVHRIFPTKNIVCVKSEEFLTDMIDFISKKDMQTFREKYRRVDVLCIDDIQFISGKKTTQEEFFHTFDALIQQKSQIILTSDRHPREMSQLESRILTRFEQGMIVDVQPPEYELRIAIIKKKAEAANIEIPTNVLEFLAERLHSNIREIEGALKKIGAVSFLSGKPITLEMVKSSIPEYFKEAKPIKETFEVILSTTARKFEVTVEEILGKSRTKQIKTARNVCMYIIKKVLDLSLPQIGTMMNRDHSTVHSNIETVENEIQVNSKLNDDIMDIIAEIKNS